MQGNGKSLFIVNQAEPKTAKNKLERFVDMRHVEEPFISILMGVYYRNDDVFMLKRSVQSILDQTISSIELLICDDGSSVKACSYLEQVAAQDSRVRLIRGGNLLSLPVKLNTCLKVAKGKWIARMDDDDYSHPQRLEKQIAFLQSHSEFDFVGCNVNLYQNHQIVGVRRFPPMPVVQDFYFSQPFIHPTLVFMKQALKAVNGYSEDKRCILCEDYDLLLRLYAAGYKGANLEQPLFDYTVYPNTKGKRRLIHRWNETVTRYRRFRDLKMIPVALPYVVKPLVVGLLPRFVLDCLKGVRR